MKGKHMDPKAKIQLVKAIKQFLVTIFVLFGEEGCVRLMLQRHRRC